jgi:TolB-like protein
MSGIYAELKRRNVFRVAVTYAVAAWIVAQVAGLAADAFVAPPWVMQMIITALVIGFLPAVVVAWAFELTPEGIRRERDLVDRDSISRYTARRLDIAVIVLLLLAIGLIVGDRYIFPSSSAPAQIVAANADWQLDSIAVLPFVDFSPERDQAWLGEGVADTLLHALAQVDGLRVSARSSSFAYRDRDADVATIGRELGVATVLEGSVQRSGHRLRVAAQLVRTDTQAQLFSQNFDRDADDIFAIQDEIAAAVTQSLLGSARSAPTESSRTGSEVYDLYLEGRQLWQERNADAINRAVELLEQAVVNDPNYAPAQAELAAALMFQVLYADVAVADNRQAIERHIDRALTLDRDNALAWAIRGHLLGEFELEHEALEAFLTAERLDPGNANIQVWVGNRFFDTGRFTEAAQRFERALELDPLNPFVRQRFMDTLGSLNSSDPRIERIARDSVRLFPDRQQSWLTLINLISAQDRLDDLVLLAYQAHQRFPEQAPFANFLSSGLGNLGLHDQALRWREKAAALSAEGDEWIVGFHQFELDPEEHLASLQRSHERWGDVLLPLLLQSLRLNDRYEEAHALFLARYAELQPRFEANEAGIGDYGLLPEGIWTARRAGDEALALTLIERFSNKLDEIRDEGVFGSMFMPDLLMAVARDDLNTARLQLTNMPEYSWAYVSWLLRHDPVMVDVAASPEGRRIIQNAEIRRQRQVERLRESAPEGLLK